MARGPGRGEARNRRCRTLSHLGREPANVADVTRRRGDDTGTAYIVRDAPADIVRGEPSPTPSRPVSRPVLPVSARTSGDVSCIPPPVPVGRRATLPPPPPLPPGLDVHMASRTTALSEPPFHASSIPPSPESLVPQSPTSAPTHSFMRGLGPRDGRVDAAPLLAHEERITVPGFDAIGTATSMIPPPRPDPAARAHELVGELVRCAPEEEYFVWPHLLPLDEHALVALVQRFPGPLWCDPRRPHSKLPKGRQLSAVAATLVAFGPRAVPYVTWLLGSESSDLRYFAAIVARDLAHPDLLEPLGRMLLHADPTSRRIAVDVLSDFATLPEYAELLAALRSSASNPLTTQAWRLRSIQALAELRDGAAVEPLIDALADKDRQIARAAHFALRSLTAHDLGTMRLPWSRWFRHNGQLDRIEWLIEGLADRRTDVRTLAAEELARATGKRLRVSEHAPRSEFLNLQSYYRGFLERRRTGLASDHGGE